jgi:hypothetical protein
MPEQGKFLEERVAELERKAADWEKAVKADTQNDQPCSPLSILEIKGIIRTTLQNELKLQIHENDNETGLAFQIDRMEKYFSNTKNRHHYWVFVPKLKNDKKLRCKLHLYPTRQSEDIVSKINKILKHFGKKSVTASSSNVGITVADYNIDKPTRSTITETVKRIVTEANKITDECLDAIGAEK